MSVGERDFTAVLYCVKILLNECAVCAADGSEEVAMGEGGESGHAWRDSVPQLAFSVI